MAGARARLHSRRGHRGSCQRPGMAGCERAHGPIWSRPVDQVVSTGQMPDQATAEAYEGAVRDLEMSPTGQAYVVARSNFEKLMQRVNQQISEGMDKGAASSIITLG